MEHLVSIFGGYTNIERLLFEISSGELDDKQNEFPPDSDIKEGDNNEYIDKNQDESDSDPDVDIGNSLHASMTASPRKRKSDAPIVLRLFGNKQKRSERNLWTG